MRLITELKRRKVLRMAVLYAIAAWLIMQVVGVLNDLVGLPEWIGPTTLALLAIGFPIALIFSWFYELTPEGISLEKDVDRGESITRVTGRRLDFIVISLLSAAVILFAYDKWWLGGSPEKSIAVLAFTNMSGDPDQEFFSDGISEDILNLLATLPDLKVISRSSSFSFKDKNVAIPTVAEQLKVAYVLEGSVRRVGDQIRVTAQLIEARTDSHLWSRSYDRELNDVFAVQDEIAAAVSDALKVKLALVAGGAVRPTIIKTANTDAYDAYLQGRELIHLRGPANMEEAVGHLKRSLRLDSYFAPAHAQLAIATTMLASYAGTDPQEAFRSAVEHLDRAQELEPGLAEGHAGRALLANNMDRDPESAIEHARKALAVNPSYIDAMNWLVIAYLNLGRYEEANATREQILDIDPLTIIGRANYAGWLSETGRVEEAHELADELIGQSPWLAYLQHSSTSLFDEGKIADGLSWSLKWDREVGGDVGSVALALVFVGEFDEARRHDNSGYSWIDIYEGRYDRVIPEVQRGAQLEPDNEFVVWMAAEFLYATGRIDESVSYFERLLAFVPKGRPINSPARYVSSSTEVMMRLADARRKLGDEDGAQAAADIAKQDHAALLAAGEKNQFRDRTEAMTAAFENDPDRAIAALKSALKRGLRDPLFFGDRIFDDMRDDPHFIALQKELDAILAAEHDKVMQLICFNNPTPDHWQPLPATCEGVVEQQVR